MAVATESQDGRQGYQIADMPAKRKGRPTVVLTIKMRIPLGLCQSHGQQGTVHGKIQLEEGTVAQRLRVVNEIGQDGRPCGRGTDGSEKQE